MYTSGAQFSAAYAHPFRLTQNATLFPPVASYTADALSAASRVPSLTTTGEPNIIVISPIAWMPGPTGSPTVAG